MIKGSDIFWDLVCALWGGFVFVVVCWQLLVAAVS